ncbi:MAG: hypothetical protein EPN93_02365 [Spirochaetes bacterium]|nr:MAG: hypothetical protein EPN93_02365 [Spirochaetota bacterium]
MNNGAIKNIFLAGLLAAASLPGCGDKPLFDELATNRLKVVIKGTFESNGPKDWSGTYPVDDSVNDFTTSNLDPTRFMVDIAEMKLGRSPFANYRQTYAFDTTNTDPFFNGTGVEFVCDDPSPKHHGMLHIYLRKLIFDQGLLYHLDPVGTWTADGDLSSIFKEHTVEGFDFNQLLVNSHYDSLLDQADSINKVFPLSIEIDDGGLDFDNDEEETVLEVRFVIKNFVKLYEYDSYNDDGYHQIGHYYAVSDWLRDMQADESDLGGNLIATARAYVPGKTGTIQGSVTANSYVVAIPADKTISSYFISAQAARPVCNDTNCYDKPKTPYLPAGNSPESFLDYYLKYEQYKYRFNLFVPRVEDGTYETQWDAYEDDVKTYKIPPIATFSTGTTYTLVNVPIGKKYKLYSIAAIPDGNMHINAGWTASAANSSPITIITGTNTIDIP